MNETNPNDVIDNLMETLKSSQNLHEVTTALENSEQKFLSATTRTIVGSSGFYAIISTPDDMTVNIKLQTR